MLFFSENVICTSRLVTHRYKQLHSLRMSHNHNRNLENFIVTRGGGTLKLKVAFPSLSVLLFLAMPSGEMVTRGKPHPKRLYVVDFLMLLQLESGAQHKYERQYLKLSDYKPNIIDAPKIMILKRKPCFFKTKYRYIQRKLLLTRSQYQLNDQKLKA